MRSHFVFILLLAAMLFLSMSAGAVGEEPSSPSPRERSTGRIKEKEPTNVGTWLVSLYRDHVSKVDGDRCPSFPSCSSYSVQAFRKHGLVMGWMMTVDRLFHEGSEEKEVSPMVYRHGRMKIYDPVENNDFWWYKTAPGDRHE